MNPTAEMSIPMAVTKEYMEGVRTLDVLRCMATMSQTCELYTPCVPAPVSKKLSGISEIKPVYTMLYERVFRSFRFVRSIVLTTSDPEVIAVQCSSDIVLVSGRPYTNDYAWFVRVRGDKIVELWEFFDTERAADAFKEILATNGP